MAREMKDSGIEWIGKIPQKWDIKKGKWILKLLERPITETDGVITCFRNGEVTLRSKRREEGFTISLKEIGYQGVDEGDLVVHGMDGFAGAIGISDSRGKGSPVLNVLESDQCKKYIMYYLRSMAYNGIFLALSTGIRVRSCDTNWNKLKELLYILPKISEQQLIANFLDTQCSHIDSVIEKTRAAIEEYKKLKQSVITEAVTKGIRPNREMKDSGIQWIGELPKEWDITVVGRLCFVTKLAGFEYTKEMDGNITLEGEVPIVRAQNIKMGQFIPNDKEYISLELSKRLSRCALDKRCLLITFIGAGIGETALYNNEIRSHLAPNVAKIVINDDMKKFLIEEYLLYFFMSFSGQEEVNKIKKATAQPSLSMQTIRSIKITLPRSVFEQSEIVAYLNKKTAAIDSLIQKKELLISELEAYKKSLIYEYVTGKKEVV